MEGDFNGFWFVFLYVGCYEFESGGGVIIDGDDRDYGGWR